MPSSQIQSSNPTIQAASLIVSKPPPPSKLPPPPPPPPKNIRPTPPPPPPPRNSSQISNQSNLVPLSNCSNSALNPNVTPHNGSSMNSINSAGSRGSQFPPNGPFANSANHNYRGFTRHGECGSRSSASSHGSMQRHHHIGTHNQNGIACAPTNGIGGPPTSSNSYQSNSGATWSGSNVQHNFPYSSSISETGSCNLGHNQDNRNFPHATFNSSCCSNNLHHLHSSEQKYQTHNQGTGLTKADNQISANSSTPITTTISRNTLFHNPINNSTTAQSESNCCKNNESVRTHFFNSLTHHHHHHNLHNVQPSISSSNLPSTQPMDQVDSSFHRCGGTQSSQSNTMTTSHLASTTSEQDQQPLVAPHAPCSHVHRMSCCNHHHQPSCSEHYLATNSLDQQTMHSFCGGCPHPHNVNPSHNCGANLMPTKTCMPENHHHCVTQDFTPLKCADTSVNNNNESLQTTAHTHNLSNSSTTTHTSNVAVKHQPQFHQPLLSRGCRSSSSQQYEQYGLSSAASTSSATASLSSYQTPIAYDDSTPLYPSSRMHHNQAHLPPPPPPPPPPPLPHAKSQPVSPANQMFVNNIGRISMPPPIVNEQDNIHHQHQLQGPRALSPPPPLPSLQRILDQQAPPLPPKPISPNASSCSTQITTVRTSSSSASCQDQSITRVTSQAGVQNPLPSSDVPPPLPPMNHGSRIQPLFNSLVSRAQQAPGTDSDDSPQNAATNLINLNYSRGGLVTDAERKTEALTRQVELELEQQQRMGEPLGICSECNQKVMPAQEGCRAMNQIYHANCFVCCECGRTLIGKTFYPVGEKVYCEEDFKYTGHMQSLEKCAACSQPIFNMILPAMGKSYHPKCFKCCVCARCLDGVPFTIDSKNKIFCVKDFHNLYSPKCAACGKLITPIDATGETVRVVSMNKDYHIDCYCCEDCSLPLTDEEPSRSYPLDNHLLCQRCHINRLTEMQAALKLA